MELSGVGSTETLASAVTTSQCTSDINRNIETEKLKSRLLDNSCGECNIKFDSSKSLEVHLQYHNKNLYTKWASEGVGSVETSVSAPPPPHTPAPSLIGVCLLLSIWVLTNSAEWLYFKKIISVWS